MLGNYLIHVSLPSLSSPNKHCLAGWAACNPCSTFRAASNPFQQAAAFPVLFPLSQTQHSPPKQLSASGCLFPVTQRRALVVQCCCKPSISGPQWSLTSLKVSQACHGIPIMAIPDTDPWAAAGSVQSPDKLCGCSIPCIPALPETGHCQLADLPSIPPVSQLGLRHLPAVSHRQTGKAERVKPHSSPGNTGHPSATLGISAEQWALQRRLGSVWLEGAPPQSQWDSQAGTDGPVLSQHVHLQQSQEQP